MKSADRRDAVRAFLQAASTGDVGAVDAYLCSGGDANATLGEGWTALHGAITRGQVRVVERLIRAAACDLNALTAVGTSALAMALRLNNNITTRMLLDGGASRATIAQDELRRIWDAAWLWSDVQHRLHPGWSIMWAPTTHHRFSQQERTKCWLVLCMNHVAQATNTETNEPSRDREDTAAPASTQVRRVLWSLMPWAPSPWEQLEDLRRPKRSQPTWVYLPPAVLQLVLQYALFLW